MEVMPLVQQGLDKTKRHTMTSMTLHHTPTTTTQLTSCVGGAAPPPHNQQPFTHWQPLFQPDCAHNSTWVLKLTELAWKTSARPMEGAWQGQRSHKVAACPLPLMWHARGQSPSLESHVQPKPALINTHTDCTCAHLQGQLAFCHGFPDLALMWTTLATSCH